MPSDECITDDISTTDNDSYGNNFANRDIGCYLVLEEDKPPRSTAGKRQTTMNARSGILAGGNWIVDKLKFVDVYPQQDALANILLESVCNGGSPFNILVDLAKLGAPFPLAGVGLIGTDADGEWIINQCAANHINTGQLRAHPGARTSYTDVMVV